MKTRYAHDYLCLPSLLQRQGYSTEMVIGQHRDLNRLQTFAARNGLQQLRDEGDFPPMRNGLDWASLTARCSTSVTSGSNSANPRGSRFF